MMFINHLKTNIINYFLKTPPMLIRQHSSIRKYRVIRVLIQIIVVVIRISKAIVQMFTKNNVITHRSPFVSSD